MTNFAFTARSLACSILFFALMSAAHSDRLYAEPTQDSAAHNISFGYANDNFLFGNEINSLVSSNIFPSRDDFITTSFFLSWKAASSQGLFSSDLFFHLVTDRERNFRTDLMMIRSTVERMWGPVRYRTGIGMQVTGNLGGRRIQNFYHRIFGYRTVELLYRDNPAVGFLLPGRVEYIIDGLEGTEVTPFVAALYSSKEIPKYIRSGIAVNMKISGIHFDVVAGYNHRYEIHAQYSSIFGSSWYYGMLCDVRLSDDYSGAVWITKDQYGAVNNLHFGMNFGWNINWSGSAKLRDVTFP